MMLLKIWNLKHRAGYGHFQNESWAQCFTPLTL
jgi:hypothetical protein